MDTIRWTQLQLAEKIGEKSGTNIISNLENGKNVPNTTILTKICETLKLPKSIWGHFLKESSSNRMTFEGLLEELYGEKIYVEELDTSIISVIESKIDDLFIENLPDTDDQCFDCLNSILVYYNILPLSKSFFREYFERRDFVKQSGIAFVNFKSAIKKVQIHAIRLFSSINEAYLTLNQQNKEEFTESLKPIRKKEDEIIKSYQQRTKWDKIKKIDDKYLSKLGYIAAEKEKERAKERKEFADFLLDVAGQTKLTENLSLETIYGDRKIRKMENLRIKFNSTIKYGFFNTLFKPTAEELMQEAERMNIKEEDYKTIGEIQSIAYDNLSKYLAADYMDVYVATSMREDSEYVAVNQFVENLFKHKTIDNLNLRYFNPTQSWIDDRVAKGIVEALMLNRADICIYMAQEKDTFGKDSEASVTLGQGKSVIVYVPKLFDKKLQIDSERTGRLKWDTLMEEAVAIGLDKREIDYEAGEKQLHAKLIHKKLENITDDDYIRIVKAHWADFGIIEEFKNGKEPLIEKWLTEVLSENRDVSKLNKKMRGELKNFFVEKTMSFEKRAKLFKEDHPLALQIIRNSGVLNGILVVRSVETCATLINSIIENDLKLVLPDDDDPNNYKLIEQDTQSTIRVISKHKLIANAFKAFYKK